mmetsp:Transcript_8632/g.18985  ORF Transcript_8632/g.18985 Transcript_8632/m.18985 type:complete len:352 (-) Transcript_8632:487-1542(-)
MALQWHSSLLVWNVFVAFLFLTSAAHKVPSPSNQILSPPFSSNDASGVAVTAFSGGIAGAVATLLLHPIDTAKTLRQSNPSSYSTVSSALWGLISADFADVIDISSSSTASFASVPGRGMSICTPDGRCFVGFRRSYSGVLPAVAGSVPSSALYFGTYETVRRRLTDWWGEQRCENTDVRVKSPLRIRTAIHAISAASGNAASSALYVPKEYLKQRSQATGMSWQSVVAEAFQEGGVAAMYRGYVPTFLRNVPGAVLRFGLYEEIKLLLANDGTGCSKLGRGQGGPEGVFNPLHFLAGATAGAVSSGIMTPVDVIKTRIITGSVDRSLGVVGAGAAILKQDGIRGLYAGGR